MSELDKGQKAGQRPKKYLWFGYGNYGGQPNPQIGGGNIRDPGVLEKLFKEKKTERLPMMYFVYVAAALIGLTVVCLLAAWGLSLVVR